MKAGGPQQTPAEPSRGVKSHSAEPRMSRTNSQFRVQSAGLVDVGYCHPSIIIGGAQQCCFVGRNKPALACLRMTCDTCAK
jgi:hypothetical protein